MKRPTSTHGDAMDPNTTPPAETAPAAAPSEGEPVGSVASDLGTPRETPPPAEVPVAPTGRRWCWAVLRVLVATLALGWWTQHAMRRHFEADPYTGPVYRFQMDDGGVGLMDDTGRILIPAIYEYMSLPEPFDGLIMVEERVKLWVVDLWGWKVEHAEWVVYAVLDTDGRVVRGEPRPLWVKAADFARLQEGYVGLDERSGLIVESARLEREGERVRGRQLISRTGQVLQSVEFEPISGTPPLVCAYDDAGLDKNADELNARLMWLQDDRWVQLIQAPRLWIQDISDSYGESSGQRCEVSTSGGFGHSGVVGVDGRWSVFRDAYSPVIANRPGSRLGDPPVLTGTEPLDGAWLRVFGSANRLVMADGLWGLQSPAGAWLCEPRWRAVRYDTDRTMEVTAPDGLVGMMDLDGRLVVPPLYALVKAYSKERDGVNGYMVRLESPAPGAPAASAHWVDGDDDDKPARISTYGIWGSDGDWIVPPIYRDLDEPIYWWDTPTYDRGLRAIRNDTGHAGVLAGDGTMLLPFDYANIRAMAQDRWYVELASAPILQRMDSWGTIGGNGMDAPIKGWTKWLPASRIARRVDGQVRTVDLRCESFRMIPDVGYLIVREGKMGLLDGEGREILPAQYACLQPVDGGAFLLACTPQLGDELANPHMDAILQAEVHDPWTSRAELLRALKAPPTGEGSDVRVVYGDYRVYDIAARAWLPQALESVNGPFARLSEARGWGLLQPDMQTVLDAQALQLPGPLREIGRVTKDYPSPKASPFRPVSVADGSYLYEGETAQGTGLFTADGRVIAPFVCSYVEQLDMRFIRFDVGDQEVLLDRAGRLIVPGGETTWAALGAPGFVAGLRGSPSAARTPPPPVFGTGDEADGDADAVSVFDNNSVDAVEYQ